MKQRPRIYYTETQKALMWDRWQKGDSLQQIAQLFDRNHPSIQRILAESGGIRPVQRRRSKLALTLLNAKRYRVQWWRVSRFARLQRPSGVHHPPSVANSSATVARKVN